VSTFIRICSDLTFLLYIVYRVTFLRHNVRAEVQ